MEGFVGQAILSHAAADAEVTTDIHHPFLYIPHSLPAFLLICFACYRALLLRDETLVSAPLLGNGCYSCPLRVVIHVEVLRDKPVNLSSPRRSAHYITATVSPQDNQAQLFLLQYVYV